MRKCVDDKCFIEARQVRKIINEKRSRWAKGGDGTTYPIPLDEPYQKGYEGTYKIRDDFARSKWGETMALALAEVNVVARHSNPEFKFIPTKKQKKRGAETMDCRPPLRCLTQRKWESLHPLVARWFYREEKIEFYFGSPITSVRYLFNPLRHTLTFSVKPYMVTHRLGVDYVAARRQGELSEKINRDLLWVKYGRYFDGGYSHYVGGHYKHIELEKVNRREYREARDEYCKNFDPRFDRESAV